MSKPVPTLVTYVPHPDKEPEFLALLAKHWPALVKVGLVTDTAPKFWRGLDRRSGRRSILELFEWKDETASSTAHQTPEVMAIWEPMGPLLESMTITAVEAFEPV